jgi:hypothetical protein
MASDQPTADLLTQRLESARKDRLDAAQPAGGVSHCGGELIDSGLSVIGMPWK